MDVKRGYKQLVTLTKRVKYAMTYIKENTNINEHRRVIVKLNNKNILKSAYRDTSSVENPVLAIVFQIRFATFERKSTRSILFDWGICTDTRISAITRPLSAQSIYCEENSNQLELYQQGKQV